MPQNKHYLRENCSFIIANMPKGNFLFNCNPKNLYKHLTEEPWNTKGMVLHLFHSCHDFQLALKKLSCALLVQFHHLLI